MENDHQCFKLKVVRSNFSFLHGLERRMLEPRPKSIRLDGMSTCVRLEGLYWAILKAMAKSNRTTTNNLLTALDREVQLELGGVKNFSSLIRIVSTAQLLTMCPEGAVNLVMDNMA